MVRSTRRIVTGDDADGRSVFPGDGAAPAVRVSEAQGGLAVTEPWRTVRAPAANAGDDDPIGARHAMVESARHPGMHRTAPAAFALIDAEPVAGAR